MRMKEIKKKYPHTGWKAQIKRDEYSKVYDPSIPIELSIIESKHNRKNSEILVTRNIKFPVGTKFEYVEKMFEITEQYPASLIATYHLFREVI